MKLLKGINIINFPIYKTAAGEIYFELKLDLTANENQGNFVHNADAIGIKIAKIDELEQSWDDREFFFSLGKLKVSFVDSKQYIREALLSGDIKPENTTIIFKIKRNGSTSFDEEFTGNLDWDFSFDKNNNATLSFSPQTEILSRTATNINGQWNDKFGGKYSFGQPNNSNIYNFREVVEDFFKLINSQINVQIYNDWEYKTAIYNGQQYVGDFNNIGVSIQNMFGAWLQPNKFTFAFENYLQVLKSTLLSLGFFGGLLSSKYAVVYNIFDYNPSRVIDISNILVDKKSEISREQLKFLRLISNQYVWQTAGNDTGIDDQKLDIIVRGSIFKVWVNSLGQWLTLSHIRKPSTQYEYWATFLIKYYANYYLGPYSKRRDDIIITGTNYDISNLFQLDDYYYLPISLTKNYEKDVTKITAVPLNSVYPISYEGEINQYNEQPQNYYYSNDREVIGEILTPDGNNREFNPNFKFIPDSLKIYYNGIRLREGINEDYQLDNNIIKFNFIPDVDDKITIDYLIKK